MLAIISWIPQIRKNWINDLIQYAFNTINIQIEVDEDGIFHVCILLPWNRSREWRSLTCSSHVIVVWPWFHLVNGTGKCTEHSTENHDTDESDSRPSTWIYALYIVKKTRNSRKIYRIAEFVSQTETTAGLGNRNFHSRILIRRLGRKKLFSPYIYIGDAYIAWR